MTLKRKNEFPEIQQRKRRKIIHPPNKCSKSDINVTNPILQNDSEIKITDLPDEILLLIFSYMNVSEIHENVMKVCKKWAQVSMTSCLWHTIKVCGSEVTTETLCKWLETAGHRLKRLKIKGRNDAEEILKKVSRFNRGLENIKIVNCWGTARQTCLPAMPLCRLLQRCSNITDISILGCRFMSCKFFRLLAAKNHFRLTKSQRSVDRNKVENHWYRLPLSLRQRAISYTGDASYSQLREFLNTRRRMNAAAIEAEGGDVRTVAGNIALYRINDGVYEQIINDGHDLQQDHINRVLEAVYGQLY